MRRGLALGLALAAIGAVGLAWWLGSPTKKRPNVLIVLWDTVRADRLSLYGHDRPTTPALEAFAADAVVYENAVSAGMWTVPSHGSMFTGLPAASHGASFDWRWLDGHHHTLGEWFAEHGYDTYAFSANPNLARRGANLLQGFEVVQTSWGPAWWPTVKQFTKRKLIPEDASTEISPSFKRRAPANRYFNGASATQRALLTWLDARPDPSKPWLVYLNYMEAHKPRIPAQRFRDAVMDADQQALALRTDVSFLMQLAYGHGAHEYSPEELAAIRGVYDATLRELDFFTGLLFETLAERGLLDDTIVVLTSDHGETLGEGHRMGHRYGLYESLIHVPLVVRYPAKLTPGRVKRPVSTQDLFGTLTALADLPHPESARLSRPWSEPRDAVFSEVISFDRQGLDLVRRSFPSIRSDGWENTFRAIRSGELKLVLDAHDHHELYDVIADPAEERDLAAERPEEARALRERLLAWSAERPPYDPSLRTPDDYPTIAPKEKEMLEILGYVVEDEP